MVQAILDGRKTQTRRTRGLKTINENPDIYQYHGTLPDNPLVHIFARIWKGHWVETTHIKCPYGQPGDLLWVRETFARATIGGKEIFGYKSLEKYPSQIKYKPSIHMPKAAARIWLQVEEVKVERLQDISDDSIIAEGVRIPVNGIGTNRVVFKLGVENSAFSFLPERKEGEKYNQSQLLHAFWAELWCEVNDRASWDLNPWVWVVKFNVLSTTGKPDLTMNNSKLRTE